MHILVAIFLIILIPLTALSAADDSLAAKQSEYDALLIRAKSGDSTVDYNRMRALFTELPAYNAYGSCVRQVVDASRTGNMDSARVVLEGCLEKEWVHLSVQAHAIGIYHKLNDTAKFNFHRAVYFAIIDAISHEHDGLSDSTAITVLYASEEYTFLNAWDITHQSQSLVNKNGSSFDVMRGLENNKNEVTLWFNVDALFKSMNKKLNKKK